MTVKSLREWIAQFPEDFEVFASDYGLNVAGIGYYLCPEYKGQEGFRVPSYVYGEPSQDMPQDHKDRLRKVDW